MARLRIFTAALAAAVLAGCAARPDPGKTGALLNALQNTAALTATRWSATPSWRWATGRTATG